MHSLRIYIAAASLVLTIAGCGEPHRAAAQQYLALAQEVLIAKGVCSSSSDCQRKELLFWEGGGEVNLGLVRWGGAYVNLYATQDQALVDAITEKFKALHAQQPSPQVTLTVYSSTHSQPKVKFGEVVLK